MAQLITFCLTHEQDAFIDGLIESGDYQNLNEVIREGLRLLKEKNSFKAEELRELIAEGEATPKIENWSGDAFLKRMKVKQHGQP
ncbi:type II toxin-antitoxin system ParD family antitoxin [Alteromonas sp. a30]|uniref:type II toxin-antitoxin system ParD family antitoxin n=1 Tax=Alteromonas sp. a30 TaxID=2730917 RepID=UPI00227F212F|nr:type II toxin-antitoxin system ParD family antitoxin [Alteromonas sp. a30]MCY7297398.1 type II toxin-antitoxin system ParD family antitoxin [Alteromonas sp. a30]